VTSTSHAEEPLFTLRGQDVFAPFGVREYATLLRAFAAGMDTTAYAAAHRPSGYNPDAVATDETRVGFLGAVFNLLPSIADPNAAAPAPTVSYELDYYNACDDHWRGCFYGGMFVASGSIGDCPR
jgi:hypothetical protein